MYSRAQNIQQTAESANQSLADQFSDFRGRTSDKFSINLEDYSDKLNTQISKEIAQRTEGVSALSNVPVFFSAGKGSYDYLPKIIQKPLDWIGEGGETVSNAVGTQAAKLGTEAGKHIQNMIAVKNLNNPEKLVTVSEDGITSTKLLDAASAERGGFNSGLFLKTPNQLQALESTEGEENAAKTAATEVEENVASTAAKTAVKDTTLSSLLEADAAAGAETGPVGAVAAGVVAATAGIVYGLTELFGHHKHHPQKPSLDSTIPSFASSYDVGKSVVSTSQQQQMPNQTMSF